jgi:hypothetical protein
MLSLRDLTGAERTELIDLQDSLAGDLRVFEPRIFAFEHGSDHRGSVLGCGVDQAHLHLVPLPFDLVEMARAECDDEVEWQSVCGMPLMSLPHEGEYVAVWQAGTEGGAIGFVKKPVSQWMRRLIARQLGIGEEWNYRTNLQTKKIRRTVDTLRRSVRSTTLAG